MKEIFLNKAIENLKSAELLFENSFYNASTNRAYYASFHLAIAAIYSIGIIPSIDHKTIQSLFSENYFNRRKIVPSKYKGYLATMQDNRNSADYKDGVSKRIAKQQIKDANEFFFVINELIK